MNNISQNNYFNQIQLTILPKDLPVKQIIEQKNEKQVLNYIKNNRIDNTELIIIASLENSWNDVLDALAKNGISFLPYLSEAISSNNQPFLKLLLNHYHENLGTLLQDAISQKNYEAARALTNRGAKLNQKLSPLVDEAVYVNFEAHFYKNEVYYGNLAQELLNKARESDYENSLAYALVAYYHPKDPKALNF